MPAAAIVEPIERSKPPPMMTIVSPTAAMPTIETALAMLSRFVVVEEVGRHEAEDDEHDDERDDEPWIERARRATREAEPRPVHGRRHATAPIFSPVMSSAMSAIVCSGGWAAGRSSPAVRSLAHDDDPVADVEDVGEAMAHEEDRDAALLEPGDEVEKEPDLLGRQRRGGLVHEQQSRLELERPRDGDHLALAAGERAGLPVRVDAQPEVRDEALGLGRHRAPVEQADRPVAALQLTAQEDVGGDVEVGAQGEVLVDHLDPAAAGVERAPECDGLAVAGASPRPTAGRRPRGSSPGSTCRPRCRR